MDPNDWQRYNKRRPQSRSGGMDLGIGGSSGSGNLGIADYLTENFDNLGGGQLSPQQQLMETQKAIREGGAMKSPETTVTRPDIDIVRFATQAPDGSNYLDPKPAEIPPYLARQISDPTPPAQPASGSGINPSMLQTSEYRGGAGRVGAAPIPGSAPSGINPQMLVRPTGDAQSRGSNLANSMPRREDFRQNESMAAKLEERANKALSSGWMSFAPNHTMASATQQLELANALRGRDEAKYRASLNQYYIQNPDKFEEWQRSAVIQQGKPVRYQSTNATERATGDMIQYSEAGTALRRPGVSETQLVSNEQITDRQAAADRRKAEAREDEQAFDATLEGTKHGHRMSQLAVSTAPQNKANQLREARDAGGTAEAVDYPDDKDFKYAKGGGPEGSPGYNSRMQAQGFVLKNLGTEESPVWSWVRQKKLPAQGGGAAAPAAGGKAQAPAPAKPGDPTRGGRAKVTRD